ncbi:MAG TPA: SH3 domain-containing protein [Steroidobacteraceae bacterium]|nr:SH3 domain-containing protein [Steroidobacteraceae bacterium]
MKYRQALLLLPALVAASAIHAETLYVIEQLVVNVNSAPDATGERIANIKSGDAVEVLDRQGDQIQVHLANGTEGWVRKSYLSAEEPARMRLGERTAEVEKLKQDVTRLEGELAAAKTASRGKLGGTAQTNTVPGPPAMAPAAPASTPTSAPASASEPASSPTGVESGAAGQPAHEPPYFMTPPDSPARPVWHWALGSFVVALGLGFALGWQMLDRRIRRKYGGLRIY